MSEIKPFSGVDDRTILSQVVPLNTPFTIGIYPTNICNFKCNYCVQSLDNDILKEKYSFVKEHMSLSTFVKTISQLNLFEKKIKLLTFMGQGEPLLNKNLPQMIRIAKNYNIAERIDIVTNASLLTPELSLKLIDSGLDALRISLQGMSSEKYLQISNIKLDFNKLVENIKYFFDNSRDKCKLFVKIMNVSINENEEQLFYDTFDSITDRMFIEQIKPVYDGVDYNKFDYSLETDRRGIQHEKRFVCPQPFFTLSIWPNGDVIPCSAIHKVCHLGNIHSGLLLDMWKSPKLKRFQQMQLKKQRYDHPQCGLCCAPDDCAHLEDELDSVADILLKEKF